MENANKKYARFNVVDDNSFRFDVKSGRLFRLPQDKTTNSLARECLFLLSLSVPFTPAKRITILLFTPIILACWNTTEHSRTGFSLAYYEFSEKFSMWMRNANAPYQIHPHTYIHKRHIPTTGRFGLVSCELVRGNGSNQWENSVLVTDKNIRVYFRRILIWNEGDFMEFIYDFLIFHLNWKFKE